MRFSHCSKGRRRAFHPIHSVQGSEAGAVNPGEARPNQRIKKYPDMIAHFVRYAFSEMTNLFKERIYSVLPVKELPDIDAGGVQAKPTTGIGVKEDGPVVKLLPENNVRIGNGFVTGVQR